MFTYPKINTIWKRDINNKIIEGDFSQPEFDAIKLWNISEKVDGMAIRVIWLQEPQYLDFRGKTDDAIIPNELLLKLKELFTIEKLSNQFKESKDIRLFGEGYGKGIQSGGKYSKT